MLVVLIISHLKASLAERQRDVWDLTHTLNLALLPYARRDLCTLRKRGTPLASMLRFSYLPLITVTITFSQ